MADIAIRVVDRKSLVSVPAKLRAGSGYWIVPSGDTPFAEVYRRSWIRWPWCRPRCPATPT